MPTPDPPLIEVETLRPPSRYPHQQLAQACLIASQCKRTFGHIRFVYVVEPREHA